MDWVSHGREEILVANIGGVIYAMDKHSRPHSGASLADGELRDVLVTCPLHGWQYDLTTGCCTHIRDECLRTLPVTIEGDEIFVELPEKKKLATKTTLPFPLGEKLCHQVAAPPA